MVVVGPRVADFVTEISIIVQKHVHFNINKWKHVPEVAKEKIVTKVLVNLTFVHNLFYFIFFMLLA